MRTMRTHLVLILSLCCFVQAEYVPLNSLTISSLYQSNEDQTSTEKPWWTDLQEKREQYKAAKIRAQNLSFNNGKIINVKVQATEPPKSSDIPTPIEDNLVSQVRWPSLPDFESLFEKKPFKATIERVSIKPPSKNRPRKPPPASSTPRVLLEPTARSTSLPYEYSTLQQGTDVKKPSSASGNPTTKPVFIATTLRTFLPSSTLLNQRRFQQNEISESSNVPGNSKTRGLFNEFMERLTSRGLLRKVPFRHIKIVFFNLLTAIGRSMDEKNIASLMKKYLEHFNQSDVDNKRRFSLSDKDFKNTSELLDQLIFNYLSDSFGGTSIHEFPRPQFTTRSPPSWVTSPVKLQPVATTKSLTTRSSDEHKFALPSLEESGMITESPRHHYHEQDTSTTTFGGVASNTARPTTKSILAELEYPSNSHKQKFQFMHEPDMYKRRSTSTTTTKTTTTPRPITSLTTMPSYYPQLAQSTTIKGQDYSIRPNFNNEPNDDSTRADPLAILFGNRFSQSNNQQQQQRFPSTTTPRPSPTTTTPEDASKNQWSQILNKLNFALEKLSNLENNMDLDILDNPQYINSNGDSLAATAAKKNKTDVVVNVVSYDDQEESDEDSLKDYFQAIIDTDSISLEAFKSTTSTTTQRPQQEAEDYFYIYDDLFSLPKSPVPGVGNKNPVPLSEFPADKPASAFDDLQRFPINIPIPLTDAENLPGRPLVELPKKPLNIGTPSESNDRVNSRTKLTVPSIIQLLFGTPTNMSEVRSRIPDFTSSGPVNIPSSIQLYGDIGKYLNSSMMSTTRTPTLQHADVPFLPPSTRLQHAQVPSLENYLQHVQIPKDVATLNGEPLTDLMSNDRQRPIGTSVPSPGKRISTSVLAALVDALKENEQVGQKRPTNIEIPTSAPSRFSFNLPSNSALPKPQSLAALEALGRQPQPVPFSWQNDQTLPTQRLPPFHQEILRPPSSLVQSTARQSSSSGTPNLNTLLRRFGQSPFESSVTRFKSPPMMLPLEGEKPDVQKRGDPFTILTPQTIPKSRPLRVANIPNARSDNILDMILRQKTLNGRRKRSTNFVLKTPDELLPHFSSTPSVLPAAETSDEQLRPEDAVIQLLQSRPELTSISPPSTEAVSVVTTTPKKTILSKPSAIESAELIEAKPQIFSQITVSSGGVQTSLLGFPNPFLSTSSSGSMSYNNLAIAAALSVIPTLVIAFPFIAPSLGKRKRKK